MPPRPALASPSPRRAGVLAHGLAVLVMLVQTLFFAEHLGASAVHGMGHAAPGARLGFLQICTGEGVTLYDPASGRVLGETGPDSPSGTHSGSHSDCAVCSSAAVCGFAHPEPGAATPAPAPVLLAGAEPTWPKPFLPLDPVARAGLIRTPPLA